jgi:hypothetical protein
VSLVFQNVNYYLGGTENIWRKSGKEVGVEFVKKKTNMTIQEDVESSSDSNCEYVRNLKNNHDQYLDDGKLEIFSYSSGWKEGWEKVHSGNAQKIYQGGGSFLIEFRETPQRVDTLFRLKKISLVEYI